MLKRLIAGFLLVGAVGVAWIAYDYWAFLHRPASPVLRPANLEIHEGATLGEIAQQLLDAEVITNAFWFKLRAKRRRVERSLKPGEYELHSHMFPDEILNQLRKGVVVLVEVSIPEGSRMTEIARRLEKSGALDAATFLAACEDPKLIQRLLPQHSPPPPHLEGYLFPETYRFRVGSNPDEVLETMVGVFRNRFTPSLKEAVERLGMSVHEAVTLASIIEKETGRADERKIVSSVMHNRLAKKMRLQVDPTVIYGIENFDGNITRAHLKQKTPYNTYRIGGLPPTPICSPGLASLEAAVTPATTEYIYYVSRNNGAHKFSITYEEHMKGVNTYQRGWSPGR